MKRYCLTVDLKDDPALIRAYEEHHRQVWPEILQSLTDSGIQAMQIYRLRTRMFMIIETNDAFSFEQKEQLDQANPKVQEWEKLMANYQQALPWEDPDDPWKWKRMEKVFDFE